MYSFTEQPTFRSKRYPGIVIQLKPLTVQRRAAIDMAIASHPDRAAYYTALMDREEIAGDGRPERLRRAALNETIYAMERAQKTGPLLRECILSIEGVKPEDATADRLIDSGPADLCEEISDFIAIDMRLSGSEEKNSSPSSDSSVPEPTEIPSTTASNASDSAGTEPATVPSTSQTNP